MAKPKPQRRGGLNPIRAHRTSISALKLSTIGAVDETMVKFRTHAAGVQGNCRKGKGSGSFLKKRTKKLLDSGAWALSPPKPMLGI
jgi:hypothetical protein